MRAKKPLDWTRRAARDVIKLEAHLARYNPTAAEAAVTAILDATLSLSDYPGLGRPGTLSKTRELMVPRLPYTIVYRLLAKKVQILRVIHQSQEFL